MTECLKPLLKVTAIVFLKANLPCTHSYSLSIREVPGFKHWVWQRPQEMNLTFLCCQRSYLSPISVGHVQYLHHSVSTWFICRHICTDGSSARALSKPSESLLQTGSCLDVLLKSVLMLMVPYSPQRKGMSRVEFTVVGLLEGKNHLCFPAHWGMQSPGAEAVSGLTFFLCRT